MKHKRDIPRRACGENVDLDAGYEAARDVERATRPKGAQNGAVTRNGLTLYQALPYHCPEPVLSIPLPPVEEPVAGALTSASSAWPGLKPLRAAGLVAA